MTRTDPYEFQLDGSDANSSGAPLPRFVSVGFLLGSLYGMFGILMGVQALLLVLVCGAAGTAVGVGSWIAWSQRGRLLDMVRSALDPR